MHNERQNLKGISSNPQEYWAGIVDEVSARRTQVEPITAVPYEANDISSFSGRFSRLIDILKPFAPAVAIPAFVAACGSNTPTEAPATPTFSPTEAPSPTIVVTPTPDATPSPTIAVTPSPTPEITPSPVVTPTPEITPSPTPAETPVALNTVLDELLAEAEIEGFTDVTAQEVQDKLSRVLDDPAIANGTPPDPRLPGTLDYYIQDGWERLQTERKDIDRQLAAEGLITSLFHGLTINRNEDIYKDPSSNGAIELALDYAYHHLDEQYFNNLIDLLRDYK